LTNRIYSYIVVNPMIKKCKQGRSKIEEAVEGFKARCRKLGLKVTPQRIAIYKELIKTDRHPSADALYKTIKNKFPGISLDTVNRALLTFAKHGIAFIVEGTGQPKRFDADMLNHQHFICIKCKRIIDFQHRPFDNIKLPADIENKFMVLKKTVYVEGICDKCLNKSAN